MLDTAVPIVSRTPCVLLPVGQPHSRPSLGASPSSWPATVIRTYPTSPYSLDSAQQSDSLPPPTQQGLDAPTHFVIESNKGTARCGEFGTLGPVGLLLNSARYRNGSSPYLSAQSAGRWPFYKTPLRRIPLVNADERYQTPSCLGYETRLLHHSDDRHGSRGGTQVLRPSLQRSLLHGRRRWMGEMVAHLRKGMDTTAPSICRLFPNALGVQPVA